ncbi:hypothetical protein E2542_SST03266 [Spatholobus suberectus]|nr:hypothetical protein E2542_SST03266 [Spatholobus suberectus]
MMIRMLLFGSTEKKKDKRKTIKMTPKREGAGEGESVVAVAAAFDENPKKRNKTYILRGKYRDIYKIIYKYVYAWLHPVCLFGHNGREKGETEKELHCTALVHVSSMKGGKRGWIYKGKVNRYLFGRKGIRVIACCGRRTRGRRKEKHRVILLHDTHCSKNRIRKW